MCANLWNLMFFFFPDPVTCWVHLTRCMQVVKRAYAGTRWRQNVLTTSPYHLVHLRKQGGERQKGDQSGRCSATINMNPIESLVSISSYTELQIYRDRAYTCPNPSLHSAAFSLASTASHERQAGHSLEPPKEEAEVENVKEEVKVVHRPHFLPQVPPTHHSCPRNQMLVPGAGRNRCLLRCLHCWWLALLLQRGDPQDDERDDGRRPDPDRPLPRLLDRQPLLHWQHCRLPCRRNCQSG